MSASATDQQSSGMDIDAREAQILGKPPRIAPLHPDELGAEASMLAATFRGVLTVPDRTTPSDFSNTVLRHPGLYRHQMEAGLLFLVNGSLAPRQRELAVLRVLWLCRAPFAWGQHVEIAKSCGLTTEEIERVIQGPSAPGWSEHERAILRGVAELLSDQMISDDTWSVLAQSWTEPQLMEFPAVVGQYVAMTYVQNSLRLRLRAGNRGLRHR